MNEHVPVNRAVFRLKAGKALLSVKIELTTAGVIGVGALVSSILLSTAGLVWVSTSPARDHPLLTGLRRR